jgi:predicted NAD/FAD-dependent oxidoreductase
MKPRIAIIGAGLSGLTLATELAPYAEITVFEKSRGVSGRMATRYADPYAFDHGTQFFTTRTPEFKAHLEPLLAQGHVAEWTGKVVTLRASQSPGNPPVLEDRPWLEPHYVPAPNMNQLGKMLAKPCKIILNTQVEPLAIRDSHGWHLFDLGCNALGQFDWVLSTAPSTQTARLFSTYLSPAEELPKVKMLGCFTLMLGFNKRWDRQWIAAKVRGDVSESSPIEWIAVNSSKPGRNAKVTSLVVHSRNEWAQAHIEDDFQLNQADLLKHLAALTGIDGLKANYLAMHRWRYALVAEPGAHEPFVDPELHLASTGDWCAASRVEDAWLNARKLAATLTPLLA